MRSAPLSGMMGARHARPDKRTHPEAFRPNEVPSLPMIAGMAHSTLKSGAATRDGVAFGVSAEDSGDGQTAEDHSPVFVNPATDVADCARDPLQMDYGQDSQR